MSFGVIIPTRNAASQLEQCVTPVLQNPNLSEILVIDSGSHDGTAQIARRLGCRVVEIPAGAFNHGGTREIARKALATDIVVYLTQDAIPVDAGALDKLVAPLAKSAADIAYGRQLPHQGADVFESLPREYNYPEHSHIRRIGDVAKYGVFTFFCSNSFAAYRQDSLNAVGGFPHVLTNEDYFVTARILSRGGQIAYVAEACAYHSHRYRLAQEFRRFFDNGYVRGQWRWIQEIVGPAEGRGAAMSRRLISELLRSRPYLIPYAVLHLAAKWAGYRAGYHGGGLPLSVKRKLSSFPQYWTS